MTMVSHLVTEQVKPYPHRKAIQVKHPTHSRKHFYKLLKGEGPFLKCPSGVGYVFYWNRPKNTIKINVKGKYHF